MKLKIERRAGWQRLQEYEVPPQLWAKMERHFPRMKQQRG